MAESRLTLRALNRAYLARQMLLARDEITPLGAVERLVALQAQLARPPFVALWARVAGFEREQLLDLVRRREVVRATMLRGTLHLASARDYLRFRAALQPALDVGMGVVKKRLGGVDLERVLRAGQTLFAERARTFEDVRGRLAEHGLEGDERAMAYAVRLRLPLVQAPAEGTPWGWDAKEVVFADAGSWLGAAPDGDARPHALVRRYLAAFGPATPADAGAWCGLKGLRAVFDEMRPELVAVRDEAGRELFDLPDAPRPGEDAEAPVRFLPDFDVLVLSHDDRRRVVADEHRPRIMSANLIGAPTFLVDGFVAGTWKADRKRGAAVLSVEPFATLGKRVRSALEQEGDALLRFVEPGAKGYEVRFAIRDA